MQNFFYKSNKLSQRQRGNGGPLVLHVLAAVAPMGKNERHAAPTRRHAAPTRSCSANGAFRPVAPIIGTAEGQGKEKKAPRVHG